MLVVFAQTAALRGQVLSLTWALQRVKRKQGHCQASACNAGAERVCGPGLERRRLCDDPASRQLLLRFCCTECRRVQMPPKRVWKGPDL